MTVDGMVVLKMLDIQDVFYRCERAYLRKNAERAKFIFMITDSRQRDQMPQYPVQSTKVLENGYKGTRQIG